MKLTIRKDVQASSRAGQLYWSLYDSKGDTVSHTDLADLSLLVDYLEKYCEGNIAALLSSESNTKEVIRIVGRDTFIIHPHLIHDAPPPAFKFFSIDMVKTKGLVPDNWVQEVMLDINQHRASSAGMRSKISSSHFSDLVAIEHGAKGDTKDTEQEANNAKSKK